MIVWFGISMFYFSLLKTQTEPCLPLQVFIQLVKQQKNYDVTTVFFFQVILY